MTALTDEEWHARRQDTALTRDRLQPERQERVNKARLRVLAHTLSSFTQFEQDWIETIDQLNALPQGTVVAEVDEYLIQGDPCPSVFQKERTDRSWDNEDFDLVWAMPKVTLPVFVLWNPDWMKRSS